MNVKKLQEIIIAALEDIKAKDIEILDTRKLTSLFDRIVIASGDSNRQVKALARNVHDKVKEAGGDGSDDQFHPGSLLIAPRISCRAPGRFATVLPGCNGRARWAA